MPVSNIAGNYSLNLTFNNILYNTCMYEIGTLDLKLGTRYTYNSGKLTYCPDLFRYLSLTIFFRYALYLPS